MNIALVNRKGGVAKTTTAINLADALANARTLGIAERNFRVLLVDLDSQANASTGLGLSSSDLEPSITSVLLGEIAITEAIRRTSTNNLRLIAGSHRIADEETTFYRHEATSISRLRDALKPLQDSFDFIIFDCPPALGMVFTMTMIASDVFVVPMGVEQFSVDGISNLFDSYTAHRSRHVDDSPDLLGILLTKMDYRVNATEVSEASLREAYQEMVFDSVIRINEPLARAQRNRQTIFQHAPSSRGAENYAEFAAELLERLSGVATNMVVA